jgi:hypothetical protein
MTAPGEFPYAWLFLASVIVVALWRNSHVKTALRWGRIHFFLETHRDPKENKRKRLPSVEQDHRPLT